MVKPALRPHVAPAPLEPVVVKLGGRALESPAALAAFTTELAAVRGPLVLVHGGGAEVNEWLERLGIAPRFEHGLRVTEAATLDVVAAVLAGLANKRLVAALRTAGVDAVGLSVLDGGSLACERHPQADSLGEVGVPVGGDAALLASLLAQGRVPVLASLGMSDSGALLNVNADDAAAALATLLGAAHLLLLSDTPGVRIDGAHVATADAASLDTLRTHPQVTGGMGPKLAAVAAALAGGAARVTLAQWQGSGDLARLLAASARVDHATVFTAVGSHQEVAS